MSDSPYARVRRKIWHTRQFRALSREARELFLYIITCPHSNILGMFVLRPGYVIDDMHLASQPFGKPLQERFHKPLQELLSEGLVKWDPDTEIMLDVEHLDKNPLDNPNQVKAAIRKLDELPNTVLFRDLKPLVERLGKPFTKPLLERLEERLGEPFGKPVTVTVTVTEEPPNPPLKKTKNRGNGNACVLPEWVPKEEWEAFVEMRCRKGTITEYAKKLIVEKLAKLRALGNDPAEVLRQSIERGWKGVFAIRPEERPYDPDAWLKGKLAEQKGDDLDDTH